MNLSNYNPVIFWLIVFNYTLVFLSLYHLIFRSHYNVNKRLLWMVALWLVPVLGSAVYWLAWQRRQV